MIIDANELDEGTSLPYDLCIVGSGPAGIALANELRKSKLRVCILESGQFKKTRHADALKKVFSEGMPIKQNSRERVVGGASLTWDGLSRPLEPMDFEKRPWVPFSGWPIGFADLAPHYEAAAETYGFPHPDLFSPDRFENLKAEGDCRFDWKRVEEVTLLALQQPQRFGPMFKSIFEKTGNTDLYTDATVTNLSVPPVSSSVQSVAIRTRGHRTIRLVAKRFVLATGGIENARLLLLSGLGNEQDQVGRYFMNHPKNALGVIVPTRVVRHLPAYFGFLRKGLAGYVGLRLGDCAQRELGVLDSYVRFEPLYPWSDRAGVQLLIKYIKSKRWLWEKLERFKGETANLRDYAETGDDPDFDLGEERAPGLGRLLLEMAKDSPFVAQYGFYRVFDKLRPRVRAIRIRNFIEMEPHPDNRVLLTEEKDCFGNPLPKVQNWATPLDQRSLVELHRVLADELQGQSFGTLSSDLLTANRDDLQWTIDTDASHHLGTTRMGTSPCTSVVDADCRLHGLSNLYLAGGSVFSASGFANPTYTIVALAIRLARHLERRGGDQETRRQGDRRHHDPGKVCSPGFSRCNRRQNRLCERPSRA